MKLLRVLPRKPGSRSARVISQTLNGKRVRHNGRFRPKIRHLVVNWGSAVRPLWWASGLNDPAIVQQSSNKLLALTTMKAAGINVPEFTTDQAEAQNWINKGKVVVGRRVLNGHGGIGCVVWDDEANTAEACPLYTKHLRHRREYRIHVFKGGIIDMVEKRKRLGFEGRNSWIRNYHNGYVFCRDNLQVPDVVKSESLKAVLALKLDFGAVDVAYREKENKAYIFEVNTAPGIEGKTIESYINAIKRVLVNV